MEKIDKHAYLKKKFIRGNQAPFMNRDSQKAICNVVNRLNNKYWRDPSRENEQGYKKLRNLCVSVRRKSITSYLNRFSVKGLKTNKSFWKFIKAFLAAKDSLTDRDTTNEDSKKIILDDFELVKTFNNYCINTVEINNDFKPLKIKNQSKDDFSVIDETKFTCQDHPSMK